MKHLLDSNTFIEAKNRYYGMKICPAYWEWLLLQNNALEIASISLVFDELKRGNDELSNWVKDNSKLFLDVSDDATQQAFGAVAQMLADQAPKMKAGAFEDFLSGADPWLIAKAMTSGATIVTHEVHNRDMKKKFSIPNVCEELGIPFMNTFELLHKLEACFIL